MAELDDATTAGTRVFDSDALRSPAVLLTEAGSSGQGSGLRWRQRVVQVGRTNRREGGRDGCEG